MKDARDLGLDLPTDLSIVGFDDIQIASYIIPGLTTIRQPAYEMERLGVKLLFQRIKNQKKPEQLMLKSSLIVRDSTVRARNIIENVC
jgi:LacI family transcriptional regulator, galactose operon repressor